MHKTLHILSIAMIIFTVLCCMSCTTEPTAAFTSDKSTVMAGDTVQFSDRSSHNPDTWLWSFEGGTPASAQDQNPAVSYSTPGVFDVSLDVGNRGGSNMVTMADYITVEASTTNLKIINNTYTDIHINIGGVEKTADDGGSITYFGLEGDSVEIYAETSGKTAQGDIIGRLLVWDFTLELTGGSQDIAFDVGTNFFFLHLTNNGTRALSPLKVNDGIPESRTENVIVPMDGVKYKIGYYRAWEYTEIKAYWQDEPGSYTVWIANILFVYPNEKNQSISLINTSKKGVVSGSGQPATAGKPRDLMPATDFFPGNTDMKGVTHFYPNN